MANTGAGRRAVKAIYDLGKSAVKKYKDKRDPKLLVTKIDPKQKLGTPEFEGSEKAGRKFGRAKLLTGLAAGYTIAETDAIPKAYRAGKYLYDAVTEKKARDKSKKSATETPAATKNKASDYKSKAAKVTTARKEQIAANKQKVKAAAQQNRASTNKEKVAANKTKVTANTRMVSANKKKVSANTARYK